ncbi:MAG: hypothetical protein K0R29_442 [Pseudobdellovibrio sp.]|jgi:predicted small lipoprotein YifL|nr:hypothetical protein [Pseudobdellovibrio sp.]
MKTTILIAAIIAGIGCGIKGPPLPPLETVNDRANNMVDETQPAAGAVSGDSTIKTSGDNTTIKKVKKK